MARLAWLLVAVFVVVTARTALQARHGRPDVRRDRQALVVDALLQAGIDSRARLTAAIDLVIQCERVDGAVDELWIAAHGRQAQRDAVARMDVDALESGAEVRQLLAVSLERSLDTDYAFLDWALTVQRNDCRPSGRANLAYRNALQATERSTLAKRDFITCWDRVARAHGLRLCTENEI